MNLLRKARAAIVLAMIAGGMAACAPVAERDAAAAPKELAFPAPPDEPRFYYERSFYADADVVGETEEETMMRLLTGEAKGSTRMAKPYAVAARGGRVYVTDTVSRVVHVFDVPGKKYTQIGEGDQAYLVKPMGIDVDASGRVYVADITQKLINVYDSEHRFLRSIGAKDDFDRPTGVAVDPAGKRVYVVDIGGIKSENHRVRVFDAETGAHLFDVGGRGAGEGELNLPRDVAIGSEGRMYVVDGGNFRVQAFDADGKFLKSWGKVGRQIGDFARPKEIATDPQGNVYVVDAAFGNFQIFSPEGEILLFIGNRGGIDAPANYMLPSGIAVDEDGRVYVVDQVFRKVDVFRPAALPAGTGALSEKKPAGAVPAKPAK